MSKVQSPKSGIRQARRPALRASRARKSLMDKVSQGESKSVKPNPTKIRVSPSISNAEFGVRSAEYVGFYAYSHLFTDIYGYLRLFTLNRESFLAARKMSEFD